MSLPTPDLEALKNFSSKFNTATSSKDSIHKEKGISFEQEQEYQVKLTSSSGEFNFDRPRTATKLKTLDAVAFSHVLHEVGDYIKILGCMDNLPQVKCDLEYQTLEDQYGDEGQQIYLFDAEALEPNEAGNKTQSFWKLQRDRSFLEQILEEADDEISSKQSIKNFLQRLEDHDNSESERNQLLDDTKDSLEMVKVLSETLQNEKHKLTNELHEKSKELGVIKDQYEDMLYENDVKTDYIGHWEDARGHQNNKMLQDKEEYLLNAIRTNVGNYLKETRINSEIEAFENYLQITYAEETENWMNKYSADLDEKEMEKQLLTEKRDEQLRNLEDLTELYELHKAEMEEYLVVREQRRAEAAELERLNNAATKIQAWWRGVMYRKGLGPYRKKKRKKGKKKNDAKGRKNSGKGKGKKKSGKGNKKKSQ